jgi:hypothetical protein
MITDLPVAVALPAPLGAELAAWVEHDLGWQVVHDDGPLTPALTLTDRPPGVTPWIGVLDGPADPARTRAMLEAGAADVVAWPDDRARVPLAAVRLDVRRREAPSGSGQLVVAGVAGGVGTSTVALAAGGLLAWRGARVLVAGSAALTRLAGVDRGAVDGHRPVAGVPRLSVSADAAGVTAWDGDLVVVDAGVMGGTRVAGQGLGGPAVVAPTIVTTRADAGLLAAGTTGRPVVVVGERPLSAAETVRALGRRPMAHLPHSVRVARAGLLGRVPAGLPGRWLRTLETGLRRLEQVAS